MIRVMILSAFVFAAGLVAPSNLAADTDEAGDSSETLTKFMALHTQGVNYELGRGIPQDAARAAKWYREAAELGYADARNDLAKLHHDGRGVPRDSVQAYFWYTLAAEQGNACAVIDRHRLGQDMTAAQIAKAQLLLNAWRSTFRGGVLSKIK